MTKKTSKKKTASKKAAKKVASKKKTVRKKASKKKPASISAEDRYKMIAEAAYYIAEKNNFSGDNTAYWLEAEDQINKQLGK